MTRTAVGVDLGGTKIAAGLVDDSGRVLAREVVPSLAASAGELRDVVRSLVDVLGGSESAGLGVGAAGLVDFESGRYLFGPNTGLKEMDMAAELGEATGLAVRVDNDANCAAWAEHRFGSGRGTRHFLCVTLGTGIGGGVVVDSRPYRGARGGAAEIGHMLVDPAGPLCGCGRRGCWEQMASGRALQRMAREEMDGGALSALAGGDPDALTGQMVTLAARQGDPLASDIVERVSVWVGWGLASLVNIFEPESIAIGGGLASDWDLLEPVAVPAMLDRMEAPEHRSPPTVVAAALGADAGMVGAACLVFEAED